MGPANEYWPIAPECRQVQDYQADDRNTTSICDFSGGSAGGDKVWLVGDSHAQQWQPPIFEIARERKWRLTISVLGACPFANVLNSEFRGEKRAERDVKRCIDWRKRMIGVIADDKPSLVLTAFYARQEPADDKSGRSQADQYRAGLEPLWRKWTDAGARVVVLADPPYNGRVRSPDCVTLNPSNPEACVIPRAVAHPPDPLVEVARTAGNPGVSLADMTDYFCDEKQCYAVVGNVAVYYDPDHLNSQYARSLVPMIEKVLASSR
jgi:hypothetical protein